MSAPQITQPPTERRPPTQPWRIVAAREITIKLRDRGFWISTVLILVLLGGASFFLSWAQARDSSSTLVVAVDSPEASQLMDQVVATGAATGVTVELRSTSTGDAEALTRQGEVDAWLSWSDPGYRLAFPDSPDNTLTSLVQSAAQARVIAQLAEQAGVSTEQLAAASAVQQVSLNEVEQVDTTRQAAATVAGFIFTILFFMSSMTFGNQIAQSVVTEKESRIVEILASAIPTSQLLIGKVVGSGVLALGQMIAYLGVGVIGLRQSAVWEVLPTIGSAAIWFLPFFLTGFLALACLWAAAGAMAARQEDLASTAQPLYWVLMVVYIAGFAAQGTLREVLSYVPIASAVLMPTRIVLGDVVWWQIVAAMLINLALAAATVWFGARIYRRSLLQTRGKLSLRQAIRLREN